MLKESQNELGTLFVVATPIGNLEDITFRAVRILKDVDIIFAEDTRTTGLLLKKYEINTKSYSYNSVNSEHKNKEVLKLLEQGKNVALVSDAGTPGVSDPGYSLVRTVREYFDNAKIVPIPGASALTAFMSVAGEGTHAWTFYGFLPHKNGRQKILKEVYANKYSAVFFESTHRILKLLEELEKMEVGSEDRRTVVLGREITKMFEEFLRGTPREVLDILLENPVKQKGEFVVMVV